MQEILKDTDMYWFIVMYLQGNKSEYLSLVSLSTNPPHVSHGAGPTIDDSHDQVSQATVDPCKSSNLCFYPTFFPYLVTLFSQAIVVYDCIARAEAYEECWVTGKGRIGFDMGHVPYWTEKERQTLSWEGHDRHNPCMLVVIYYYWSSLNMFLFLTLMAIDILFLIVLH